jgi:hypothetical protein
MDMDVILPIKAIQRPFPYENFLVGSRKQITLSMRGLDRFKRLEGRIRQMVLFSYKNGRLEASLLVYTICNCKRKGLLMLCLYTRSRIKQVWLFIDRSLPGTAFWMITGPQIMIVSVHDDPKS